MTSSDLLPKYVLDCTYPLHQSHIYTDLCSYLFRAVPQSHLRCCLPGHRPHFAPKKTSLTTLAVHFFQLTCSKQYDERSSMILIFQLRTLGLSAVGEGSSSAGPGAAAGLTAGSAWRAPVLFGPRRALVEHTGPGCL